MFRPFIFFFAGALALGVSGSCQVQEPSGLLTSPERAKAADPFSVATGIYSRAYTDFSINDSIPIEFVRTYRNMDALSRSFGIGTSTSYDMFIIGDPSKFSWVALVLADGSRIQYTRVSPGTSYADGVFESQTSPDEFLDSKIYWNGHGAWTVRLINGLEYTVQGCNAGSKPGQCAVTEIKNAIGERLVVERDRDGTMRRIVSPHGHTLEFTTDAAGRITRATFGEHWMNYSYDENGHLSTTLNSKGARQKFTYDAAGNMLSVHENGYIVMNRFDGNNRFSWQRVSDGEMFSAKYRTDAKGAIIQTDVQGPDGLVQYHFDATGREVSEEFRPGTPWSWQLDYGRDPHSNVLQSLLLTCGDSRQVFLPTTFDRFFANLGEAHKEYLTQMCWHTKPAPQKTPKAHNPGSPIVNGD